MKIERKYRKNKRLRTAFGFLALCGLALFVFAPREWLFHSIFPSYAFVEESEAPIVEQLRIPEPEPVESIESALGEEGAEDKEIIITYDNIFSIKSFDIIKKNLYNIDRAAYVFDNELDFNKLISIDTKVDLRGVEQGAEQSGPKILIFHTHSQEAFADSKSGNEEDTIVGVGAVLARILTEKYGAAVLHHKGVYDMVDGVPLRGGSYELMEKDISRVLEEHPSIEVMIDLHRDSLPPGKKLTTTINGAETAQIMYFNGICRLNENGLPVPTEGLENDYIAENLALSLRMKLLTNELFPGFSRKNYIKPYRYSLHMKPNSLLIEVGSDANTVSEAKNAMVPLAEVLVRAFS